MGTIAEALHWATSYVELSMYVVWKAPPPELAPRLEPVPDRVRVFPLEDDDGFFPGKRVVEYDFIYAKLPAKYAEILSRCLGAAIAAGAEAAWFGFEGSFDFEFMLTAEVAAQTYAVADAEGMSLASDDMIGSREWQERVARAGRRVRGAPRPTSGRAWSVASSLRWDDALRVNRYREQREADATFESDERVLLRFSAWAVADASAEFRVRLRDGDSSLVELRLEEQTGTVRGATIVWFSRLSPWPAMRVRDVASGLPMVSLTEAARQAEYADAELRVCADADQLLLHWGNVAECEASVFAGRVRFLVKDGVLVGLLFSGLTAAEMRWIQAHASRTSNG